MVTETASQRRKPRENQYLFDLGKKGRKTGLTVPDSGIRDEHGLEPMDHLFSSPEKAPRSGKVKRKSAGRDVNATISSEEDMDVGQSTIPEPTAVLTERKRSSMRMPPPRSKSPIKTFLQSPARRHPSLGPVSSPIRGSIVGTSRAKAPSSVSRRLDFSVDDLDHHIEKAAVRSSPHKRAALQRSRTNSFSAKLTNGTRFSPNIQKTATRSHEDIEQDQNEQIGGDSYQVMDYDDGEPHEQHLFGEISVPESSPEAELESPIQATRKKGRAAIAEETAPRGTKRKQIIEKPAKRRSEEPDVDVEERPAKKPRGRPKKSESGMGVSKKSRPRTAAMRDSSPSKISSPAEVQRGPPRPKNNRGLYILRRETPDDGFSTRSGRHVIKPVAYWKNEAVVYGEDEYASGDASFLLPTIKEVIRKDQVEQPKPGRGSRKGYGTGRPKKPRQDTESEEEEDLIEPWELEPGRIYGAVRMWNPDDAIGEESSEKEDEIALSSAAIITREIPGATFKFAKTLTLPFFGSGMVDLPPGAVKKPKNSRRMQMIFFVFSGRVSVTVNENAFRIGKGGMWQVPRGNFYSIENDYEKPARVFFAQGCATAEGAEAE